jgi:rare lipoprotein A
MPGSGSCGDTLVGGKGSGIRDQRLDATGRWRGRIQVPTGRIAGLNEMMRRRMLASLGTSFGLLALCDAAPAEAREAVARGARRGIAVWYGGERHGRTMANGRPFDQGAMTAASTRFPLGTRARVTDLETRRSVTVTITDYTNRNSRVLIDLARGAARALGIESKGRARVEVVPVGFDRSQARQQRRA